MKRNKFSLSNYKLFTCDMGNLVPVGLTEVLPGDTIQQATSLLLRCSPLLAPVMHPVQVKVHHWFVPHRLVWEDFEDFITGGPDGNDASVFPQITINNGTGHAVGSLADYLGVPTLVDDLPVSALPFRGYSLIWNEFYRDQDLQTELTIDKTSGADTTTNTTLQAACWEKDYFTSARPWTQKGDDVTLSLGTTAPVERVANAENWEVYRRLSNNLEITAADLETDASGKLVNTSSGNFLSLDPNGGLVADLSSAVGPSVNALRTAFALQRYKEARARYGSRYSEYLRYLGVRSSDGRINRPEYLGGGKQTIQFSEVIQTAGTTGGSETGVGNMKGHGISAMRTNRYRKFFDEHGYVFTFMSVRPKTMYVQGLPKHWSKTTKEDFFQKELEGVGQQEILNKELYAAHSSPNGTFGYQDRYDEYRRAISSVSGEFRSTLNFWHMARIFSADTTLNSSFVTANPTTRCFQSTATDNLWVMANNSIQARRLVGRGGPSYAL